MDETPETEEAPAEDKEGNTTQIHKTSFQQIPDRCTLSSFLHVSPRYIRGKNLNKKLLIILTTSAIIATPNLTFGMENPGLTTASQNHVALRANLDRLCRPAGFVGRALEGTLQGLPRVYSQDILDDLSSRIDLREQYYEGRILDALYAPQENEKPYRTRESSLWAKLRQYGGAAGLLSLYRNEQMQRQHLEQQIEEMEELGVENHRLSTLLAEAEAVSAFDGRDTRNKRRTRKNKGERPRRTFGTPPEDYTSKITAQTLTNWTLDFQKERDQLEAQAKVLKHERDDALTRLTHATSEIEARADQAEKLTDENFGILVEWQYFKDMADKLDVKNKKLQEEIRLMQEELYSTGEDEERFGQDVHSKRGVGRRLRKR